MTRIISKSALHFCLLTVIAPLYFYSPLRSQHIPAEIPQVYRNLTYDDGGYLFLELDSVKARENRSQAQYTLNDVIPGIAGDDKGLHLQFPTTLAGGIYFGFINYRDSKYPMPVYRKDFLNLDSGHVFIDLSMLTGVHDMIAWQNSGQGTLGYRLVNTKGDLIYDGIVSLEGKGPFKPAASIIEGPSVNLLNPHGCTISFKTNEPLLCQILIEDRIFEDRHKTINHLIEISGLEPGRHYTYTVKYKNFQQFYAFKTAPPAGTREPFTFSYLSDSRHNGGGGERNIFGTNAYIVKKALALAAAHDNVFMQFTGDLINGVNNRIDEAGLQYANWKNVVTPFAHYFPVYTGMGNHEKIVREFYTENPRRRFMVDRFPFASESAEVIFAEHFIHPRNGPRSEDGSVYDPDAHQIDFPPYDETVFYYTYDNTAMIVLNTHYWYPLSEAIGGCPHGYIMDNQMKWLGETLELLEKDDSIDHIFVTCHTPFLPNSGHLKDGMWHYGNNRVRPVIAGSEVKEGIIERRDRILDMLINRSKKVVALLTGDEHNYCKTEIGPETPLYPENYPYPKLKLHRTVFQINNGSAGAPYQSQQYVPWSDFTTGFTTQYALCLFDIDGAGVRMRVLNPDTLEEIDVLNLR